MLKDFKGYIRLKRLRTPVLDSNDKSNQLPVRLSIKAVQVSCLPAIHHFPLYLCNEKVSSFVSLVFGLLEKLYPNFL